MVGIPEKYGKLGDGLLLLSVALLTCYCQDRGFTNLLKRDQSTIQYSLAYIGLVIYPLVN